MKDFLNLAKERYSVRSFLSTPVEETMIEKMLEAAMAAPTARNLQPQRIWGVRSPKMLEKLGKVCPCLYGAPLVFVVGYDPALASQGRIREGYSFGEMDASIACTHLMLEAAELGLGSCWVGYFCEKEVQQALDLPENLRLCALLPVGYAAPDARPGEGHLNSRKREEVYQEL